MPNSRSMKCLVELPIGTRLPNRLSGVEFEWLTPPIDYLFEKKNAYDITIDMKGNYGRTVNWAVNVGRSGDTLII